MHDERVEQVKARFGREDMLELVRAAGRRASGSGRVQCPLEGCRDEGKEARPNASVFSGKGGWRLYCHRCHETADYLALYQVVKGVDFKTALAELTLRQPAKVAPRLRVVRGAPRAAGDKRSADEVRRLWDELQHHDVEGEAYLEGRRLGELPALGYVRFATESCIAPELQAKAEAGYRAAVLLADLTGRARGIQFRNVRPTSDKGKKVRSLSRGLASGVYFGRPGEVLDAHTIVVTEGIADTLTALLWAHGAHGTAVVGAPGTGQVPKLAEALDVAGVDVTGRTFVLLAQHDRGPRGNSSLVAFTALKQQLQQVGATVVLVSQPPGDSTKDWADAWREEALPAWPPEQLRRMVEAADVEAEDTMMRAEGAAVWQAREPSEPEWFGKDLTTLEYLLSAEAHRKPILGAGNWELNQLTGRVEYGRRPLEEADYTRIRLQLESYRGSVDKKRLKFSEGDISAMARVLAERHQYHPVRAYLQGLKWGGVDLLEQLGERLHLRNELELHLVERWMLGAVARALQPGCKMDNVLVLVGPGGCGKSRFLSALAGSSWFTDTRVNIDDKDTLLAMRQVWIYEWAELDALKRARNAEAIKAFLSASVDKVRDPYGKKVEERPRWCVIAGTTNESQFLSDPTGNRRFWVARTTGIDVEWVREHRDQLWAQVMETYRLGGHWWLEGEFEELNHQANEQFEVENPWQPLIEDYLAQKDAKPSFRMEELLEGPLKLLPKEYRSASGQVATILKKLGYESAPEGKTRRRTWRRAEGPNA